MNSANPTATIRPDVLLLAAERIHQRSLPHDQRGPEGSNSFSCVALADAAKILTGCLACEAEKTALFETFSVRDADGDYPAYIWDFAGDEYEARILGLLLLREMLKPERKRRPKTVKRKRALP